MSAGAVALLLVALLLAAHAGGFAFARLRQPRVVGEIVGGALLGPAVLALPATEPVFLDAASTVGLVALMFLSGAGMRGLLLPEDRRAVAWLAGVGTALPFVVTVAVAPFVPLALVAGDAGGVVPIVLVLGIAAAVTSIPVISRIFHDLGVLDTRFARLILGVAVVEDVALWGVLAVATALAASSDLPVAELARHLGATLAYVVLALSLGPRLVRRLESHGGNVAIRRWPLAWTATILAVYAVSASACGVSLVFGAFFAGFALGSETQAVRRALEPLEKLSYTFFIPLYFALVGFRLELGAGFSLAAVLVLLVAACAVKLAAVAIGARLAGFRGLDVVNLAVATNARGGPGIVLASVAYEARIVNAAGYTSLVLLAVVTSQAAGVWLERVLRRRGGLLSSEEGARPRATSS